jgi:hypothetical protein|nr:helix-turn-helix domain-containing protein [Brevundimonas diminuta]
MTVMVPVADLPLLVSIKQTAKALGLSEGMVRRLIGESRIAHVQAGKAKRMVPREAIEVFVNENTVQPCRDGTMALACGILKSGVASTSFGRNVDAAESAAQARLIATRLKSRFRTSFESTSAASNSVTPLPY